MVRCIIIEDEKPAARRLGRMLQFNNIQVDALLHSVYESVVWLQNHPEPDLIFVDIQLSDGLSFDIFKEVQVSSALIFTTAYDQYALNAFKLNSIDYLLKPVKQEELHFAIDKYQHRKLAINVDIQKILDSIDKQKAVSYRQRFMVSIGQHLQSIDIQQIECFYSQDKTTYIYTPLTGNFIYEKSLDFIESQLNPKDFFRVSRKFIISYSGLADILTYSNSRLKIILKHYREQEIIVARERVKAFKKWLAV